jgi:hypothetical protein
MTVASNGDLMSFTTIVSNRNVRRGSVWIGVLAMMLGVTSSVAIWLMAPSPKPQKTTVGAERRGTQPTLPWSEIQVSCAYPSEIRAGDDLRVSITAQALRRGRLSIESVNQNLKVYPNPFVVDLKSQVVEVGNVVVSDAAPGRRQVLLTGRFTPTPSTREQPAGTVSRPEEPETVTVDTCVIEFDVLPNKTFGLTDPQLKALQALSGVIGVPALLTAVLGFFLPKQSTKEDKDTGKTA